MEMTGTGDAKLYGYMLDNPGVGGHILGIDKTNGDILSTESIGVGNDSDALAFASWGGAFYIFTSAGGADDQGPHQWGPGVPLNELHDDRRRRRRRRRLDLRAGALSGSTSREPARGRPRGPEGELDRQEPFSFFSM